MKNVKATVILAIVAAVREALGDRREIPRLRGGVFQRPVPKA